MKINFKFYIKFASLPKKGYKSLTFGKLGVFTSPIEKWIQKRKSSKNHTKKTEKNL
jgi:hypothetical protein